MTLNPENPNQIVSDLVRQSRSEDSAVTGIHHSTQPTNPLYASIAVGSPGKDAYTYSLPPQIVAVAQVGMLAVVPYGFRRDSGFILAIGVPPPPAKYKAKDVLSLRPEICLPEHLITMVAWAARYYRCHLGTFLASILPRGVVDGTVVRPFRFVSRSQTPLPEKLTKQQKKLVEILADKRLEWGELLDLAEVSSSVLEKLVAADLVTVERVQRMDLHERVGKVESDAPLTQEQHTAVVSISQALMSKEGGTFLLHGVTGSGKTRVYLEALRQVVSSGKQGLVLLPEIALTPQLAHRFSEAFPRLRIWHSAMSDGERHETWSQIASGSIDVVIGTRSALFAPLPNLGLVIVDEEHDQSYKQDRDPRYNARDLAVVLGKNLSIPVVLGSATPSLETYHNARTQRYRVLSLRERPGGAILPECRIVDMAVECQKAGRLVHLSKDLRTGLIETLAKGLQSIVLLNRRGWSPIVGCHSCGHVLQCKRCDISLTWHREDRRLRCHYCGHESALPLRCPLCQKATLQDRGLGTEQLEALLIDLVPGLRTLRLDADTVAKRGGHASILSAFGKHQADCLVGTQMVAKGHDFPKVALVGILGADKSLAAPDFRAAERTYQLVAQVAGRAGRAADKGLVIVQSFDPEAQALVAATTHKPRTFYETELAQRKELCYPPIGGLVRIQWSAENAGNLQEIAEDHCRQLSPHIEVLGLTLLGPVPAGVARVKDKIRWTALIKGGSRGRMQDALERAGPLKESKGVQVAIDVDPYSSG